MAKEPTKKPYILVLICEGGGGHRSAGVSLKEILGREYQIEIVNLVKDILHPIDLLKRLTLGTFTGEDCYNYLMQKDFTKILKFYTTLGNPYMYSNRNKIAKLFDKYLKSKSKLPDLIISTIPYMNVGLLITAHRLEIPFFLLATDLDTSTFLNGFNRIGRRLLRRFKLSLAYERPELVIPVFKNSILKPHDIVFPGFPVRPACQRQYTKEEIDQLKSYYGMSEQKQIITMIMGAVGSKIILEHTQIIAKLPSTFFKAPFEVNICVGHNKKIFQKIVKWLLSEGGSLIQQKENCTSILMPGGNVMHIRGFTDELILIMACSDLIITKTGSCTVNEAIYLGKKLLLDNTPSSPSRYLPWEQFNIHFVKRHRLGAVFTNSDELSSLVPFLLSHVRMPEKMLQLPNFQTNISSVVSSMLEVSF